VQHEFWQEKWTAQEIGFHNSAVHPMLAVHFGHFNLGLGSRIFVPLCGKSLDLHWLRSEGYKIVGVELAETAVISLFEELGIQPNVTLSEDHKIYSADGIEVFVGDIFKLTAAQVGKIDFVYDRASMVALPPDMRAGYASKILEFSNSAPQMLIVFEYAQEDMSGPPFAVFDEEIQSYFGDLYTISILESTPVAAKLKGRVEALEIAKALHAR